MATAPWASGPGEILRHGLTLLQKDSDTSRRLAMLNIDNAVELIVKTYLGLPKRVTGLSIARSKYDEFSESFPKLLDALQEFASSKITGISLGEIEWYHRLRNQLYHEGNGLTVEREKVTVYAELAKVLFKNLFGEEIDVKGPAESELLGEFLMAWADLERLVYALVSKTNVTLATRMHLIQYVRQLEHKGVLSTDSARAVQELRAVRNSVVHGDAEDRRVVRPEMVERVRSVVHDLELTLQKRNDAGEREAK